MGSSKMNRYKYIIVFYIGVLIDRSLNLHLKLLKVLVKLLFLIIKEKPLIHP